MNGARTVLLVALFVGAVGGSILFFGSDGPVSDDPALAHHWAAPGVDLQLRPDGELVLFLGTTTAGTLACGRWRAADGVLQMRTDEKEGDALGRVVRQPGLHTGTYELVSDTALRVQLKTASLGGRTGELRWLLRRREPAEGDDASRVRCRSPRDRIARPPPGVLVFSSHSSS